MTIFAFSTYTEYAKFLKEQKKQHFNGTNTQLKNNAKSGFLKGREELMSVSNSAL